MANTFSASGNLVTQPEEDDVDLDTCIAGKMIVNTSPTW